MIMPSTDEAYVFAKGTEIDLLVKNLIECGCDKDEDVRQTMLASMVSIGVKEPKLVLSTCLAFLKKNMKSKKVPTEHRVVVLTAMEKIIKESIEDLADCSTFVSDIVKQVVEEMTMSKDVVPDWQSAASDVLVALSTHYCKEVMEELTNKLVPSTLPHFFVIQTLGNMATNNAYHMVPYLSGIITQTLTFLGLAKADNMRWVIATSLARFCEAIQEFLANPEQGHDSSITRDSFSNYIFSAYEILFNTWLSSRETKLRVAVLDALGQMVHVMDRSTFEQQFPKLVTGIIGQYKRSSVEPYHVSRALSHLLEVATGPEGSTQVRDVMSEDTVGTECLALSHELDSLLNCLFVHLATPIDYNQPLTSKNHNELKRCFATLGNAYPDRVVTYILGKLDSPEKLKVAGLLVIRHLVSSCGTALRDKQSVLVSGLRGLLSENLTNRVRLQLAQCIIAMGGQGYLELEGGTSLVEFIVRQCTLGDEPDKNRRASEAADHVNNAQLRHICENILHLSSSTVEGMRSVLWPYLLELVVPVEYTEAIGPVCSSLAKLLQVASNEEVGVDEVDDVRPDMVVDYDEQVNIPRPQFLVARMIVLAGWPLHGNKRGLHILRAMKALAANFHENLREIWNIVIPKLVNYYKSSQEIDLSSDEDFEFDQTQWEDLMLKMVAKSIEQVCDEEWTIQLGEALGQQIMLYDKYPEERSFLFKCLGTVMANSSKKAFIESHLELVFQSVRHNCQIEREGCAVCFGLCAASHLDAVIVRLETQHRSESKRSSGLIGFIKDRTSSDPRIADKDQVKATMLLCYGYVIFYAQPELVTSRLEANVLKVILPAMKNVKDMMVKQNVIRCIELIGRSLDRDHLGHSYRFEGRSELLGHLSTYIKAEPMTEIGSETRAMAMQAATFLVRLDPALTDGELRDLVSTCVEASHSLPQDGVALKKVKDTNFADMERLSQLMTSLLDSLDNLLVEVLKKYFSDSCLTQIFKVLQKRIESIHEHERLRSLQTLCKLLQAFLDGINMTQYSGRSLSCLGQLLGQLVPRVADPSVDIRQVAIDCVYITLQIQSKLEGGVDEAGDRMISALPTLKERLKKVDSNIMFTAVSDLSKVVSKKIPRDSLPELLTALYDSLLDCQSHGASACCLVMNSVFKGRGAEMTQEVSKILTVLHDRIQELEAGPARVGTLRAVRTLASQHLLTTLNTLMTQTLPLDSVWSEMLMTVCTDKPLLQAALAHLLDILARAMPYEDREDPRDRKARLFMATQAWLSAVNCAQVACSPEVEGKVVLDTEYSRILAAWLGAVACAVNCHTPTGKSFEQKSGAEATLAVGVKPVSLPIEGLRRFLTVTESHDVIEELTVSKSWEKFELKDEYLDVMPILARALCETQSSHITALVNNLTPLLTSVYEPQRVMVTAFFGALIAFPCSAVESLLEALISHLLSRLGDGSGSVRRLALEGLGHVGACPNQVVQRHANTLLSALACGMDDRNDPEDQITHAAMDGLSKVMSKLSEPHVREVLVSISLKMLPCYEKPRASVRASAFRLFGTLAAFAVGPSRSRYLSQLDALMVPLIMHLHDPDDEVVVACKVALKQVVPLLGLEEEDEEEGSRTDLPTRVNELIQTCLKEEGHLHYGEFLNDLAKLLVLEFPQKVNDFVMNCTTYFKSEWPEIQCNAAMLLGFLLTNFGDDLRQKVQKEHICMELIQLLHSQHSSVRGKAAEAISLLHMY